MAKIKGNGTLVYIKETPTADFSIATGTYASSVAFAQALIADDYTLVGCVFSATPAGYSYTTIENEPCLEEAEGASPFQVSVVYNQGDIVGFGKDCYVATMASTVDMDGNVSNPQPTDAGQTMWTATDCDCAYPTVELGIQETDENDFEIAYCPGEATTDLLCNLCGDQVQVVIQFPCYNRAGTEIIPVETWAARVTSFQPQSVVPGELMKADATFTRTSTVRKFTVDA